VLGPRRRRRRGGRQGASPRFREHRQALARLLHSAAMPESSIDALLARPVRTGTRLRGLELLERAALERSRLGDAADSEAVHDFRVALRRLRSLLKTHRPFLDKKVEKMRKRLGDVADLTGDARDAEVQLEWLETQRPALGPARRAALDWLEA